MFVCWQLTCPYWPKKAEMICHLTAQCTGTDRKTSTKIVRLLLSPTLKDHHWLHDERVCLSPSPSVEILVALGRDEYTLAVFPTATTHNTCHTVPVPMMLAPSLNGRRNLPKLRYISNLSTRYEIRRKSLAISKTTFPHILLGKHLWGRIVWKLTLLWLFFWHGYSDVCDPFTQMIFIHGAGHLELINFSNHFSVSGRKVCRLVSRSIGIFQTTQN